MCLWLFSIFTFHFTHFTRMLWTLLCKGVSHTYSVLVSCAVPTWHHHTMMMDLGADSGTFSQKPWTGRGEGGFEPTPVRRQQQRPDRPGYCMKVKPDFKAGHSACLRYPNTQNLNTYTAGGMFISSQILLFQYRFQRLKTPLPLHD